VNQSKCGVQAAKITLGILAADVLNIYIIHRYTSADEVSLKEENGNALVEAPEAVSPLLPVPSLPPPPPLPRPSPASSRTTVSTQLSKGRTPRQLLEERGTGL
jgi:hypothetical protein